jgi:DNA-binding NarL/FixJ family response regulator
MFSFREGFAEFFRLSPTESRLAVALLAGKKLSEVAMESGVQITTLRTQLSSILPKTGVTRQIDLIASDAWLSVTASARRMAVRVGRGYMGKCGRV